MAFQDNSKQTQKEQQAFEPLLKIVEALAAIPDRRERIAVEDIPNSAAIFSAGKALAEAIKQALDCQYVGMFALDPPNDRQRLLGVSGLDPQQKQRFQASTDHIPLEAYIDATAIAQLRANHVVTLDLEQKPFMTSRPNFGARYRLVVPMILHNQLIGFFTIAKTEADYPDVQSAYTPEDIALAKGMAQLTALIIEQVRLLQEWAEAHANELALQEINHRYDAFLALACHELCTPLTSVKISIQLMLRQMMALEKDGEHVQSLASTFQHFQHLLERAVHNITKLEQIVNELLDVARIQADKLAVTMRPGNLVEIVRQVVADIQDTVTDRSILLSLPAEEFVPVNADANRIGQVITNYLTNALKYSLAGRSIAVSLVVEGLFARVSVRDEGPGISLKDQARIFERFYRAPNVTVQSMHYSDANLGLGLYLCREIIEQHQGHVGMRSIADEGSTFWFTLPLATPAS